MDAAQVHHRLNTDLEFFAEHAPLLIKDKQGRLIPWRFNIAQKYTHDKLEEQLAKFGYVRALILKGRQQGESTYVEGRGYHTTTRRRPGTSAFILSHEGSATNKLFTMLRRYHENVQAALKPEVGKDNPRALDFPALGSEFEAATANNEQAGRGGTAQFFHGSEVAYWDNAYEIQDGAIQTIALLPGTEIILESTANGPLGLFYEKCQQAIKGEGDYILIFIPWYWQEEYERNVAVDFQTTEEEEAYIRDNLTKPFPYHRAPITRAKALRKIAWRRATIVDLSNEGGGNFEIGQAKFRTIYPANPIEAFQASGAGLFRADAITAARASILDDAVGARILGCDLAGDSDNADRTVLSLRQGRRIIKRWKYSRMKPMEAAGIIAKLIKDEGLDMVFIDRGYGEGTIDRLVEMGYGKKVIGIAFNERTLYPDIYANKRTEIFLEYAKWLNGGDVRIPDDDEGHAALSSIPPAKPNSNGLLMLPPKDVIKKNAGASVCQDIVDADALTFSYPVRGEIEGQTTIRKGSGLKRSAGGSKSSVLRGSRA